MRKLIVCIFAIVVLLQAVEALECYHCLRGGRCTVTNRCGPDKNRCVTVVSFASSRPQVARRCGKQLECDLIRAANGPIDISCCETDLCNL